ncbi:MAG: DUF5686 and carboxypeptidase regulatory-like domain-containing protein, partial [Bacteroidota bacterium]
MRFRIFLCLLVGLPAIGWSVPLRGVITDPTGEPVPFVSVYVENTTYGVAANAKGEYYLELDPGTHRVVFQMLGFATQTQVVEMGTSLQRLNVVLQLQELELAEVTIYSSGRDPAYAIIEQAMERRKGYLQGLEGFTRTTYTKATSEVAPVKGIRSDTTLEEEGIRRMNFVESFSTTHFERPDRYKEIKTAYRDLSEKSQVTTNVSFNFNGGGPRRVGSINPYLFYLTAADANFNFYQNSLTISSLGDLPYPSPIGVGALLVYKYELEATFTEEGKIIHKIRVIPRNKEGAAFSGHIFIEDKTWAISAVDLEINPSTLRFFRYFRVLQQYSLGPDSVYVPEREEFFYHALDGRTLVMSNTVALHTEYQINPDFPPRFFNNELRRIEEDAIDKDSSYWAQARPISLKVEEQTYVSSQDSARQWMESDEYKRQQDSAYNHTGWLDILFSGFGRKNSFTGWEWQMAGLVFQARPLMVGGYHQAISGRFSKEWTRANRLSVSGEINYGFRNQDVRGGLEVTYRYLPKKFGELYVEGGDKYTLINSYDALENILSRSNYISQTYGGVGHRMEFFNGFYTDFKLFYELQKPITGLELAPWSQELFGEQNLPEDFEPYRQLLFEAKITYTPGQQYYLDPYRKVILGSKYPTFNLHYRKGVPNIFGSNINFDFLELSATQELKLKQLGVMRYNVFAGRFLNDKSVRFIEHKWFRGSDRYFLSQPLL